MKKLIDSRRLRLDSEAAPTAAIWTHGSDWSHARILAQSNSASEDKLVAPQIDSKDLRFEVHYQTRDRLSYVGFSRQLLKHMGLQELVARLSDYVQNSTAMNDVVADLVREKGSALDLSKLMFGVERAWLENPRIEAEPSDNLTLTRFLSECARAQMAFKDGVSRPIVCEFAEDQDDLWLAFLVSSPINGRYFVDLGLADELARKVLQLV